MTNQTMKTHGVKDNGLTNHKNIDGEQPVKKLSKYVETRKVYRENYRKESLPHSDNGVNRSNPSPAADVEYIEVSEVPTRLTGAGPTNNRHERDDNRRRVVDREIVKLTRHVQSNSLAPTRTNR